MKIKQILAVVLSLVMVMSTCIVVGAAASTVTFTVEECGFETGDTVKISVALSGVDKAATIALYSGEYDREYLEFTGTEEGDVSFNYIDDSGKGDDGTEQISLINLNILSLSPSDVSLKDGDKVIILKYTVLKPITEKLTVKYVITTVEASGASVGFDSVVAAVIEPQPQHTHTFSKEWTTNTKYHWHKCIDCDETIDNAEHVWNDGEVTKTPTETKAGEKTYTCEVCKKTKTEEIPATGHTHNFSEAWSSDETHHWHECTDCGDIADNAEHVWNDGEVTKTPTETKAGEKTYTCEVCEKTKTEEIPATGHTHDFSEAWSSDETHHWHKCTGCDDIADEAEHIPSGWIVDREATHSRDGKMHRECKVCGYILEKSVIEAEGSDFDYSAWYYARQQLLNQTFRITAKAGVGGTITDEGTTGVKFGNSITYKITPDAGYEIEAVYVDGKNIGAVDEFTFSDVRGNAEISVTFKKSEKTPAIEAIDEDNSEVIDEAEEIVEAWVNPFIDIFESDDCYEAVRFVYENGIFRGVSENEFAPATTMTRAMFVTVLGRLAAVDESAFSGTSFSDVPAGEWYSAYVEWASRNGIVNGYGDDTFGPNDEITVEQAAVIIARYAEFMGVEVESETTLDSFADVADVADWAADQMAWAVENGIYNTEEFLNPKAPASRSLIAEMLYAFSELN